MVPLGLWVYYFTILHFLNPNVGIICPVDILHKRF